MTFEGEALMTPYGWQVLVEFSGIMFILLAIGLVYYLIRDYKRRAKE